MSVSEDDWKWRPDYWYLFCRSTYQELSCSQYWFLNHLPVFEISHGQNQKRNISMRYLRYLNIHCFLFLRFEWALKIKFWTKFKKNHQKRNSFISQFSCLASSDDRKWRTAISYPFCTWQMIYLPSLNILIFYLKPF